MAEKRFDGRLEAFYVTTTDPDATPLAPASYTKVGFNRTISVEGQVNEIDGADKDVEGFENIIDGRRGYTLSGEFNRDRTGDAGQEIVEDGFLTPGTEVFWLLSTNVSGDKARYGKGVVTAHGITSPDGDVARGTLTIRGKGAYTRAAVPA